METGNKEYAKKKMFSLEHQHFFDEDSSLLVWKVLIYRKDKNHLFLTIDPSTLSSLTQSFVTYIF